MMPVEALQPPTQLRKLEAKVDAQKARLREVEMMYLDALSTAADAHEVFNQNERDIRDFQDGVCPRCCGGEAARLRHAEALGRRGPLEIQWYDKRDDADRLAQILEDIKIDINVMETEIHAAIRASRGGGMF